MRYVSAEQAHQDHIKNYRSDGVKKGKGQRYSSDYLRVKFVLDSVPKNSYLLDVGCNAGTIALRLNMLGCFVCGVDIVPELVEKAKKNGVNAQVGTAEDLSMFKDNQFDAVICCEVLEHLFDPLPAIKEAHRVLKPGGKYILTVPHPSSIMAEKLGDYHQTNFSMEIIETLLHSVFQPKTDKQKGTFVEIPYIPEYCLANKLNPEQPQWLGLEITKYE